MTGLIHGVCPDLSSIWEELVNISATLAIISILVAMVCCLTFLNIVGVLVEVVSMASVVERDSLDANALNLIVKTNSEQLNLGTEALSEVNCYQIVASPCGALVELGRDAYVFDGFVGALFLLFQISSFYCAVCIILSID